MTVHYIMKGLNQTQFKGDLQKLLDAVFKNETKLDIDVIKEKGALEVNAVVYMANADIEFVFTAEEEPKFKGYLIKVGQSEGKLQMSSFTTALKTLKRVMELHNDYIEAMTAEMENKTALSTKEKEALEEEEEKPKTKAKTKSKLRGKK